MPTVIAIELSGARIEVVAGRLGSGLSCSRSTDGATTFVVSGHQIFLCVDQPVVLRDGPAVCGVRAFPSCKRRTFGLDRFPRKRSVDLAMEPLSPVSGGAGVAAGGTIWNQC